MENIHILSVILSVLRILPFIVTPFIAFGTSEGSRQHRGFFWGSFLGLVCNSLALYCADRVCFGTVFSFNRYRSIITAGCSLQELQALVASSIVCMVLSVVFGLAIRTAVQKGGAGKLLRKTAAVLSLMLALCLPLMLVGYYAEYSGTNSVENGGRTTAALPAPRFSRPSGFYEEAFELAIQGDDDCRIYYTLDGSRPSNQSPEYSEPILIQDASLNENNYCMRTNVSTGFYSERILADTTSKPPQYRAPDFLIDKCTVVRAVCVDSQGNMSEIRSGSYFVGFDQKSGYAGMNILSMIVDPPDLFDYENGIYVTGKDYDDYIAIADAGGRPPKYKYWWWWNANYRRKGIQSEKRAWIDLFDGQMDLTLSKNIGVRVQGGGSRGYLPRSFNLYARKIYDGDPSFAVSLDDSGFNPQRMTLFAGGDAYKTKLEDYLMSALVSDRAFSTMAFQPCVLFLNGEYWGNYWLTEKYDEEYLAHHYQVDRSDVVMVKNREITEGYEQDRLLYNAMNEFISDSDMTVEENLEKACEMIDIDSFIDYYAALAYICRNNDWPASNIALWRTRSAAGNGYADGRWRWMLFDVNGGSFSVKLATEDTFERLKKSNKLFNSLMKNRAIERRFVQTLKDLALNNYNPERVRSLISDFKTTMSDPLRKEYARFHGRENSLYEDYFLPHLSRIERFLLDRYDFINDYCDAFLSQSP